LERTYQLDNMKTAEEISKDFYQAKDLADQDYNIINALREGFIQGYTLQKKILYFTNDKNMMVKYDDDNIVIRHDNETGEFVFERVLYRGHSGERLTPHYVLKTN